jgi:DNA-binding CsgD family transcriptional regulator
VTDHTTPDSAALPESECRPIFSGREREVLHHFSNGLTYLQTARRMGIAARTVDMYLRRIRAKAGVASTAQLTRLAVAIEECESEATAGCAAVGQRSGRPVPATAESSGTPPATRPTSSARSRGTADGGGGAW